MSTPKPEHIDAVDVLAQVIAAAEGFIWPDTEAARDVWREKTHAAMLDALTRHGVLTEETRTAGRWTCDPGPHTQRRLVTSWEPTR